MASVFPPVWPFFACMPQFQTAFAIEIALTIFRLHGVHYVFTGLVLSLIFFHVCIFLWYINANLFLKLLYYDAVLQTSGTY